MKLALIVIDVQKAYHHGPSKKSMDSACEYINAAIDLFRKHNLPIIWVQDSDEEDGVVPGTVGYELIDSLTPLKGDYHVNKFYGNAFNKTDLASYLEEKGIDTPLLTGYCAEYCVLSTYRGALDVDLSPILLRGAIATGNDKHLDMVMEISDVMSFGVLQNILE